MTLVQDKSPLRLVSYLAPNSFWLYQAIAVYLEQQLQRSVQLLQRDDPLGDAAWIWDHVDLVFICGLPLVWLNQEYGNEGLMPVVAPVMAGDRYQDQPIYFTDVIVQTQSPLRQFEQLSGKRFCYNDSGSNSGYHLVKGYLSDHHYPSQFIATETPSGSHQTSIQWVVQGRADWAAIDSTVLEQEYRDRPALQYQLRVLKTIGPCPIPPIAVSTRMPLSLKDHIQALLLQPDFRLKVAMAQAGIKRYTTIPLEPYQSLRVFSIANL